MHFLFQFIIIYSRGTGDNHFCSEGGSRRIFSALGAILCDVRFGGHAAGQHWSKRMRAKLPARPSINRRWHGVNPERADPSLFLSGMPRREILSHQWSSSWLAPAANREAPEESALSANRPRSDLRRS